jgi:hypothetical protein
MYLEEPPPAGWILPPAAAALGKLPDQPATERNDTIAKQRRLIALLVLALLLATVAIAMPYVTGTWRHVGPLQGAQGLLDPQELQRVMVRAYSRASVAPDRAVCIETSSKREFICDLKYTTVADQTYRVFVSADGVHWIATPYYGN